MSEIDLNNKNTFKHIQKELHDDAMYYWYVSRISEIMIFAISTFAIFTPLQTEILLFVTTTLAITVFLTQWRSEFIKQKAQYYLRKYEYWDGLGLKPNEQELRDAHIQLSQNLRTKILKKTSNESYFASETQYSNKRMLENLEESSWWSKSLANTAYLFFLSISIAIMILGIITLIIALQINNSLDDFNEKITRVVVALFVLIFSAGYLRTAMEYHYFSNAASKVENKVNKLLQEDIELEEIQATMLLNKYQIERVIAPIIPTMIWKMRKNILNQSWKKYQSTNKAS